MISLTAREELLAGFLRDAQVLASTTNVTTPVIVRARRHTQIMGPWWCPEDLKHLGLLDGDVPNDRAAYVLSCLVGKGLASSKKISGQRFYRLTDEGEAYLAAREGRS